MLNPIAYIRARWKCHKEGHLWVKDNPTLGGWWVRCTRCHHLDEYLPGVHEPRGMEDLNKRCW